MDTDTKPAPSRMFHTFICHRESEERGRGDPAGAIAMNTEE